MPSGSIKEILPGVLLGPASKRPSAKWMSAMAFNWAEASETWAFPGKDPRISRDRRN